MSEPTAVEPQGNVAPQTNADLVVIGRALTRSGTFERRQTIVADGRIVGRAAAEAPYPRRAKIVDVGDAYVLPGAVDAHVHSYSHPGEGLRAATSAAAAGGVTTIVEMPFDGPGPVNSLDRLKAKRALVADEAVVDVALLGTVEPGGGWRRVDDLVDGGGSGGDGVVGFKVSLFDTDPYRFPRIADDELLDVMSAVGGAGSTLCTHAENNEIIKALLADEANRAATNPDVHARTRPPVSETLGVLTAMEIAAHQGNALHLCHLSLGRSTALVDFYRGQGVDVSFETCPHYLLLSEDDMRVQRGRLKINPPLRGAADRDAMWDAVVSGLATVISSDHAPWPAELKDHERILANHSGAPGTETLVSTTVGECLRRYGEGDELATVVRALTANPADRYGIGHRKGHLEPGYDADLMVLAPSEDHRIDAAGLHSNAGWSPYDGHAPGVRVTMTISRGRVVWDADAERLGRPGQGELVGRQ